MLLDARNEESGCRFSNCLLGKQPLSSDQPWPARRLRPLCGRVSAAALQAAGRRQLAAPARKAAPKPPCLQPSRFLLFDRLAFQGQTTTSRHLSLRLGRPEAPVSTPPLAATHPSTHSRRSTVRSSKAGSRSASAHGRRSAIASQPLSSPKNSVAPLLQPSHSPADISFVRSLCLSLSSLHASERSRFFPTSTRSVRDNGLQPASPQPCPHLVLPPYCFLLSHSLENRSFYWWHTFRKHHHKAQVLRVQVHPPWLVASQSSSSAANPAFP